MKYIKYLTLCSAVSITAATLGSCATGAAQREMAPQAQSSPFQSPYFDFATDEDAVEFKAVVQRVPDTVDDNMVYYCRSGVYAGRQIVYKGLRTEDLIRAAHGVSAARAIWNVDVEDAHYIAEVIVPEQDEQLLQETLRRTIDDELGLQSRREVRLVPSYRLEVLEGRSVDLRESDGQRMAWSQRDGEITGEGLNMHMLAFVIERVTGQRPVINAAGSGPQYHLELRWIAGDMVDLKKKLNEVGLALVPDIAEVEMLVVDPAPTSGSGSSPL